MRILLIQPGGTIFTNNNFTSLQFPLSLGYIASVLINAHHNVKMLDLNVMDTQELGILIKQSHPEVVGLTAFSSSIFNAKKIIDEVKEYDENIITILGGVHASALPMETMEEIKNLDFLVFGEGEVTVVQLLDYLTNNSDLKEVEGIVFRNKDSIIMNNPRALIEDLDTIPFPVRHLLPFELYSHGRHVTRGLPRENYRTIELITSRGCPNKCIFCASHINYGQKVRFRSFQNIATEIDENIKRYGITHVDFEDDTFTINKLLVKRLCVFLKKRKLTWNCLTRINNVDYNLLKFMADSGCIKVSFGVESGNPEILKKIKKGITIPQIIKSVKDAKKAGIHYVECFFIIGVHPDESLEQIKDTVKLISKLQPDSLTLSIMSPYPGTEIFEMMKQRGYISEKPDWSQFSVFGNLNRYKRLRYLSPTQLYQLQRKILRNYYLSPKYLFSQIVKLRKFSEIKYFMAMTKLFLQQIVFGK